MSNNNATTHFEVPTTHLRSGVFLESVQEGVASGPFTVEEAGEQIRGLLQRATKIEEKSVYWFNDGSMSYAQVGFTEAAKLREDAFRLIELSKTPRTRYDHLTED